jgi:hypothetical protein
VKQVWLLVLSAIVLTIGIVTWVSRTVSPPVETVVASSLQSVQAQNRLTVFAGRFVTVVTSSRTQMGLAAEKTLILPAMVRYDVDLAKLRPQDVRWDAPSKTLTIALPPISLSGPEFDLPAARDYASGAVLMTLTDVEKRLDADNRVKARDDVLAQAKSADMSRLARDAAIRAVSTSFAMPLAAAGVEAQVKVEVGS